MLPTIDPKQEPFLLEHHRAMLRASAISEAVAFARGYRSISDKAELRPLGFGPRQCLAPTLLLPVWGVSGGIVLHHHRPDEPRLDPKSRKIIKYEFPAKSTMCLDVHPHIREQVRDPKIPLWITEGIKKVDAALSHGLCCIGLLGVWNWRGTNEYGGKTALLDWEKIALKGRVVNIVFDADFAFNSNVFAALKRLHAFLKNQGAQVQVVDLNRVQLPGMSDAR